MDLLHIFDQNGQFLRYFLLKFQELSNKAWNKMHQFLIFFCLFSNRIDQKCDNFSVILINFIATILISTTNSDRIFQLNSDWITILKPNLN